MWEKCSNDFLVKFFPIGKTNLLRSKISNFQQQAREFVLEAWERLQEYVQVCPHHGMEDWLLIQNFYHRLSMESRQQLDAAARGAFFSLKVGPAKELIEKMVENQGWTYEHLNGMSHSYKINFVSMEYLLSKLEERANWKRDRAAIEYFAAKQPQVSMSCEERGGMNHTSDDCPSRDLKSLLNDDGYGPSPPQPYQRWNPQINQGNSPIHPSDYSSVRDLVFSQAKINEQIHAKLFDHDRILGDIHARLDEFSLAFRNQLNFNERLENQLSTLISKISHNEKLML